MIQEGVAHSTLLGAFQSDQAAQHFIFYKVKVEGTWSLLFSIAGTTRHHIPSQGSRHGTRAERHLRVTASHLTPGDTELRYIVGLMCPLLRLCYSVAYY